MSTGPIVEPTATPVPPPAHREIVIYSHSALFYWWPVWAVGFLMFALTIFDGHEMILVPAGTEAQFADQGGNNAQDASRVVLVAPSGKHFPRHPKDEEKVVGPYVHMAQSKSLGVLYATMLLVIIIVSNVPLRGLWSVIIILGILLLVLIFNLTNVWNTIVSEFRLLDIRINAGGYLFISMVLFIIWAVTVFIFDHRTYVAVTPGQVRLCLAVGAGETVYDTTGMTFQKQQNDLFRHWIVGLGSGDLIIHRSNTNQEIDMPNVLFIGAKVKEIEQLIKERKVV
jgi:hypothetical protein